MEDEIGVPRGRGPRDVVDDKRIQPGEGLAQPVEGRVARPFGSALTDPGWRLSRTRLFPEVTRTGPLALSRGE
jgi:hypothetical protein